MANRKTRRKGQGRPPRDRIQSVAKRVFCFMSLTGKERKVTGILLGFFSEEESRAAILGGILWGGDQVLKLLLDSHCASVICKQARGQGAPIITGINHVKLLLLTKKHDSILYCLGWIYCNLSQVQCA